MTNPPVRRRICVDIEEADYQTINKYIPHNSRQAVFKPLISQVCEELKSDPQGFVSRAITNQVKLWVEGREQNG